MELIEFIATRSCFVIPLPCHCFAARWKSLRV